MIKNLGVLFKKRIIVFLLSVLLIVMIWIVSHFAAGSELVIPSPVNVFYEIVSLLRSSDFLLAVSATLLRAVSAFLIAFVSAFILGLFSGINKYFHSFLSPFISLMKTVPFISIILLALIWFESDTVPVFACFLVIFPVIYSNIYEGIRNVDKSLVDMAKLYDRPVMDIALHIYLPSIIPFTLAGVSSGLGITWKIIIAAEVLSEPFRAIGTGLQNARLNLDTAEVFAWTIVAVVLSLVTEGLSLFLFSRIPWRRNGN